jgi:predicted ferric reductase
VRDAVKGVLIGIFVLALLGAIAARVGSVVVSPPRPEGFGAWMFARATGLLAYVALSLDVLVGLLVSTRAVDRHVRRGQLVDLHGWLSPLTLAFTLAHAGALLADRYVRFDLIDIAVPFASSRWPITTGMGILGGYLLLFVHTSFGLRRRIGTAMWRRIHYLSFVAFVLVTIHAVAVGTDRSNRWFAAIYVVQVIAVASLVGLRLIARGRRPR